MGLFRSDYMLDEKTKSLLQIEMNTISTSFSGVGVVMTKLHRSVPLLWVLRSLIH